MHLNEYQLLASQTDQQPETEAGGPEHGNILVPLLGLAGEVGELLGEHKKLIRDGDSYRLYPERFREELGDLLWYLSNVATKHGLTLEEVAGHNLDKTRRRWNVSNSGREQRKLLDDDFPDSERIPRLMDVSIDSGKLAGSKSSLTARHSAMRSGTIDTKMMVTGSTTSSILPCQCTRMVSYFESTDASQEEERPQSRRSRRRRPSNCHRGRYLGNGL